MTELDHLRNKLNDTQKAIEKEAHKDMLKDNAENLFAIYKSYLDAGFDKEQAWYLFGTLFTNQLNE